MRLTLIALICIILSMAAVAAGVWPAVAVEARLWNTYPLDQVTFKAWDGPAKPLNAVRVVAPIGGLGTGQLVATQADGVKELGVQVTVPEGWPADSVTTRYQTVADEKVSQWRGLGFLPKLVDLNPGNPVVPIRIVVWVPRTTKAGTATASIAVTLGGKVQIVPVNIECGPFVVPEKGKWSSHYDIYQSPEAVARMYNVELWSEKHWALVEQSFKLMGDYPNHVLWVPMMASGTDGLTESMVRYQKDGDNWTVDTSRLDRYLDLFQKYNGEPTSMACFVWGGKADIWMSSKTKARLGRGPDPALDKTSFPVTGIDGKEIMVQQFSPDAKACYTAPFAAVRASVAKREWKQDCVQLGLAMDVMPTTFFVDFLKEPSGNAQWVKHAHDQSRDFNGVPVAYAATARFQPDWDGAFYNNPRQIVGYPYGEGPAQGLARCYAAPGQSLGSKLHGIAGPMADFWTGVLWVGGQPTMKMYGQYLFQPGPNGAEHSMHSLSQVEAAQAMEAAYLLGRDGKQAVAQPWLNWCVDIIGHTKRLDWVGQETTHHPEQIPDMEAAMFKVATVK